MKMARNYIEINGELKEKIKLFCFLRRLTAKEFAVKSLTEALEPYKEWLENFQKSQWQQE